jgi:GH35 family endo-1,4-beta-xylanase
MSVMNGNPLVYHHGLPDWLTKGNFSKDELTK